MKTAFLSALGMMGRRHLNGLVQAGFHVTAMDIHHKHTDTIRKDLDILGIPPSSVQITHDIPSKQSFNVAIFAETAPGRLGNFQNFVRCNQADRILLEKPLTADPFEVQSFYQTAHNRGLLDTVQVNLVRRQWPHILALVTHCAAEERFAVTMNGGAVGLGCMGIHYLDTFLALCGEEMPKVTYSELSPMLVASGRGVQFQDFGGDFVLSGSRGRLLASLDADSSANVVMTVRGSHFLVHVDYTDMRWKVAVRNPASTLPNYRYGAEYSVVEDGPITIPSMDAITHDWALERRQLPTLEQAMGVHELLDQILQSGGARPPYRYT